ncbi:MAG: DNA polymerase III subunit delta' [Alphaproteobacteria bacterium]|nr:DNA polymerase III subunit delta' [Alphaproteobacteria bacterium]
MDDLFGNPDPVEDSEFAIQDHDDEQDIAVQADIGLPPPRQSDFFLGQEDAEARLIQFVQTARVPHGLIFAGPKGIGKATMAFRFARALFKGKTDKLDVSAQDPIFRRVAAGGHGDLLTVERAMDEERGRPRESLDVDTIRRIPAFMRMTAGEGGWRVVIIDDADTMNRAAQNALLKILEEPPSQAILILIAHNAGALLPTIRSRTQMVRFTPLREEAMQVLLQKATWQAGIQGVILQAGGSIGRALEIIEGGGIEVMERAIALLQTAPDIDWVGVHAYAEDLGRRGNEAAYQGFADFILWVMAALCVNQARGQVLHPAFPGRSYFEDLTARLPSAKLGALYDALRDHFDKIDSGNLDKRQGVTGAFALFNI